MNTKLIKTQGSNLSDKNEYIAIDFFRLIFAIGIIVLHLRPFTDINSTIDYYSTGVLTRVCVPFFFLTSGFFLKNKINDFAKTKDYIFRIFKMYLLYSIINFPEQVINFLNSKDTLFQFVRSYVWRFFFIASYGPLWYFVGLIFATALLYILIKAGLKDKALFAVAVVLYIIGVAGNAYITPIKPTLAMGNHTVLWLYFKLFDTTRNGIFFGFPFLFAGYFISKNKANIKKHNYLLFTAVSLILMIGEGYLLHSLLGNKSQDMLFTLPVVCVFLFLWITFINGKSTALSASKNCRNASAIIFGLHLFVNNYVDLILEDLLKIKLNSMLHFLIIAAIVTLLAFAIVSLSKKKKFKWLKIFY